jgi:glyoxylase-like metal-dependent hydrolase (beta-lactamase superfamily II)
MVSKRKHPDVNSSKAATGDLPLYRVYALKYAERDAGRPEHFIGGDPHDTPMPMDYFVWAIVADPAGGNAGSGRTWVVDTGFGEADAERRGRRLVRSTTEALATIGIDAAQVTDVILTHLHYDHVGGFEQFPGARFHLQDREMAYATGRHMTRPMFSHAFTATHVADLVLEVHRSRVMFWDGDHEVAPGISVHLIGGHTAGLQVVRVNTASGWLVLASDATHYYENMDSARPFPVVVDVGAMVEGWETCRRLATHPDLVIPGHDPAVLTRFPPAATGLDGIAVRLDGGPAGMITT